MEKEKTETKKYIEIKVYTITYTRNNGAWKYQNIYAENEEQAREVFNVGLKGAIERELYKIMTKKDRENEFNKFEIVTVTEIIPKKKKDEQRKD